MIDIYPSQMSYEIIIQIARELNVPGINGGLVDAKPHLKRVVDEMYARGYCFAALDDSQREMQIIGVLNQGRKATLK